MERRFHDDFAEFIPDIARIPAAEPSIILGNNRQRHEKHGLRGFDRSWFSQRYV